MKYLLSSRVSLDDGLPPVSGRWQAMSQRAKASAVNPLNLFKILANSNEFLKNPKGFPGIPKEFSTSPKDSLRILTISSTNTKIL